MYIYIYIYDIYAIMKTMCPPSYHRNGSAATWAHDVRFISLILLL